LKETFKADKYDCFKKKGLRHDDRPFKVYFYGEGSIDDGGPLRETFDFVCTEL
jgi:hypothetical protein